MGIKKLKYYVMLPLIVIIVAVLGIIPPESFGIDGLTVTQQRTICIFVFAALMWITEVIPDWVTSLIVILLSLLTISDHSVSFMATTGDESLFVSYRNILGTMADPVIMLFLGGFVLAIVCDKYGIDNVIARKVLGRFGNKPQFILLGFLVIISTFSMFMSNTATAAMFLTFLSPILVNLPKEEKGKTALVLAIPLASDLGGIGTPIGTPPNATVKGALENCNAAISFGDWTLRMIPFVIIMILIAWVVLMLLFPFKTKEINLDIKKSDRHVTWRNHVVWAVLYITIILWVTEQLTGINANIVALAPLVIFSCTGIFDEDDIKKINWSILWLVAGGLALGTALDGTGLAELLIKTIDFSSMNIVCIFIVAGSICCFMSNFISNSATAALLIPIMIAFSQGLIVSDLADDFNNMGGTKALNIFVSVCASLAMVLPVSTPPNSIAASTGMVKTRDMAKTALIIGVLGFVLAFFWLTVFFPF